MKNGLISYARTSIVWDPVEMLPTLGPVGVAAFLVCRSLQSAWIFLHCTDQAEGKRDR